MKKETLKAWMLVEMLEDEEGHSISDEVFFTEKDAQKAKASWEADWDVFKEVVPVTITYKITKE